MLPKLPNKILFTSLATCLTILLVLAGQSSAQASEWHRSQRSVTKVSGALTDLDTETQDALDGATAQVRIDSRLRSDGATTTKVRLKVSGVQTEKGTVFGAHVHTGPCVKGDGAAAGPHFNITTYNGEETVVSPETEVWLDFDVNNNGRGRSRSTVEFALPAEQAQSIVIHEMATNPDGGAGARLGCIAI